MHQALLQRELVDIVTGLDEPYRTTVLLRYIHGLEPRELALRQGVPLETVRTRLKRGLERSARGAGATASK